MKWIAPLFVFMIWMPACRPHYDFAAERSMIRQEAKSDSLWFQTDFQNGSDAWKGATLRLMPVETGGAVLGVDTPGRVIPCLSPAGMLRSDYVVSARVKIAVNDSTDLGYAGIVFDHIDTAYYRLLVISNKGSFYLKDRCNSEDEFLIPKINSRYLNKGRQVSNTIEIRHRRKEVHILFNGNLAAICKLNSAFSYGETGLMAATAENRINYSPVKALFEQFVVKKIKEPAK